MLKELMKEKNVSFTKKKHGTVILRWNQSHC